MSFSMEAIERNWKWVVVLASFLVHVICDGITYAFGVMVPEFLHSFHGGIGFTAWITSILIGMTLGAGPVAGALANHFGCRKVVIAGSLISAVGSVISFFATSVVYLMVSVGVIMGFGFSLMFCPSVIIVNLYFQKKRAFAVGIVVCGAGIGTFIFAPFNVYLIENYSWRGAFLIYGGIILNGAMLGLLYRDPPKQRVRIDSIEPYESANVHQLTNGSTLVMESPYKRPTDISNSETILGRSDLETSRNRCFSLMTVDEYKVHAASNPTTHYHIVKPLERKDLFFSGYALDEPEPEVEVQPDQLESIAMHSFQGSKLTIDGSVGHLEVDGDLEKPGFFDDIYQALKRLLDLSLLKDPIYIAIAVSNFLTNIGYDLPRIFLPDMAEADLGIQPARASWLLSIWGISNTVGRVLIGYICDHKWAIQHRLWIYNVSLMFAGIINMATPWFPDYNSLAVYSAVFGLSLSTYISLTSVVLVDLLGLDRLTNAFGLLLFFQGLAAIIGPPIGGAIVDHTKTYDHSFIFAGASLFMSGAILIPVAWIKAKQRKEHSRRNSDRSRTQSLPPIAE